MNKENLTLIISSISLIVSVLVYKNNKKMKQLNIQPEYLIRQLSNRIIEKQIVHLSLLNKGSLKITDLSARWISNKQNKECDIYISNYRRRSKGNVVEEGKTTIVDMGNITGVMEEGYVQIGYRDALRKKRVVCSPIIKINNKEIKNEMDLNNQYMSEN